MAFLTVLHICRRVPTHGLDAKNAILFHVDEVATWLYVEESGNSISCGSCGLKSGPST